MGLLIGGAAIGALIWPIAFLLQIRDRHCKPAICCVTTEMFELPRQEIAFTTAEVTGLFVCRFGEDMSSRYSSSTLVGVTLGDTTAQPVALLRLSHAAKTLIDALQDALGTPVQKDVSLDIRGIMESQLMSRVEDSLRSGE
ncbi:MAG: hypothetical protein AAF937_05265 [Planctomycetota bacterium]